MVTLGLSVATIEHHILFTILNQQWEHLKLFRRSVWMLLDIRGTCLKVTKKEKALVSFLAASTNKG